MGDYYVDDLLGILLDAGCRVAENSITHGWQQRSRSSGGFNAPPLGVQWHHTASSASVESDLSYMIDGSPDRPVGNVLLDRIGIFWPIAAGAANTSGKGGPSYFSRGACPLDSGNTHLWSIEIANSGVGEPYSQETIDAAFKGSNALNAHFGNIPEDVITHAAYTTRKIDPATATAVQGPWKPGSVNSSGTWNVTDLKAECRHRAGTLPPPEPPRPIPEEDVSNVLVLEDARNGNWYRCGPESKTWVIDGNLAAQLNMRLAETAQDGVGVDGFRYVWMRNANPDYIASCGPILGPRPAGVDEYGR